MVWFIKHPFEESGSFRYWLKNWDFSVGEPRPFAAIPMPSERPSLPPCETAPPLVERSVLHRRIHLLEDHRFLVFTTVIALRLGGYLEELHEAVYLECLECWRWLYKPTASKNKYSFSQRHLHGGFCVGRNRHSEREVKHFARNGILRSQIFAVTNLYWAEPDFTFSKCVLRRLCHDWKHHSWSCTSILRVCQRKVVLMAGRWGLCLPCFLYLLLTWADCCASVNPHRFSWEWNVITAAGCVHQVHWRTGSLGFCVISGASNVPHNAFFSRRWHWLSELDASSALNAVPLGSRTTSSVFTLTQLKGGSMVQAVPVGGQMLEELVQNRSGSLWMNKGLKPGLKCLWPKWTVSQDHLIAEKNWDASWWSMRFWEGEQRPLDLCRPNLLSPSPKSQSFPKIVLKQTELFWCHATIDCDGVALYSQIK